MRNAVLIDLGYGVYVERPIPSACGTNCQCWYCRGYSTTATSSFTNATASKIILKIGGPTATSPPLPPPMNRHQRRAAKKRNRR